MADLDDAPYRVDGLYTDAEIIEVNIAVPGPRGERGPQGVAGEPGRDGSGGVTLSEVNEIFVQNVPSDTWTLHYNLPYIPTVTVVDSAGSTVEGEVQYAPGNIIHVKFAVAFSGTVYLN